MQRFLHVFWPSLIMPSMSMVLSTRTEKLKKKELLSMQILKESVQFIVVNLLLLIAKIYKKRFCIMLLSLTLIYNLWPFHLKRWVFVFELVNWIVRFFIFICIWIFLLCVTSRILSSYLYFSLTLRMITMVSENPVWI